MSAILVSAFPGMGKTYAYNLFNKDIKITDSDSSHFNKDDFPENYIKHIKENIPNYDLIFISSHKEVRDMLDMEGIDFDLFYPDKSRKNEFIENYVARHSKMDFIRKVDNNWDDWIDEIEKENNPHCHIHCLKHAGDFIGNNPMILQYINQVKSNREVKEVDNQKSNKETETSATVNFTENDLNLLRNLRRDMWNASIGDGEGDAVNIAFKDFTIPSEEFYVLTKTINFLTRKIKNE